MYIARAKDRNDFEGFDEIRDYVIDAFVEMINSGSLRISDLYKRYTIVKNTFPYNYSSGANKAAIFDLLDEYVVKFNRNADDYFSVVREAMIYEKACEEGVGKCFAKTYYIGTVDFIGITIQEKVYVDEDYNSDVLYDKISSDCDEVSLKYDYEEYKREISEDGEEQVEDYESWKNDRISRQVENVEDEEFVEIFCNIDIYPFFDKWHINDIHCANFGFRDECDVTSFCLIDFSGYCSWEMYVKEDSTRFPFQEYEGEEWVEEIKRIYFEEN